MFIRPLPRISKGEKSMTFIVRPHMGITSLWAITVFVPKVVSVPVWRLQKEKPIVYNRKLSSPYGDYLAITA